MTRKPNDTDKPTVQDREAAEATLGQWLQTLTAKTAIATSDMNRLERLVAQAITRARAENKAEQQIEN